MSEVPQHLVRSYDEELKRLRNADDRDGRHCGKPGRARRRGHHEQGCRLPPRARWSRTRRSMRWNAKSSSSCIRMLALRQPMAERPAPVVAALKITGDLERIGDYAANVAKRSIVLDQFTLPYTPGRPRAHGAPGAGEPQAVDRRHRRERQPTRPSRSGAPISVVDDIYNALFRELITYMMEDPRNITPCTHLLFIAKNLERIGDHATNVAENGVLRGEGRGTAREPAQGRHVGLCDRSAEGVSGHRNRRCRMPEGGSSLAKPLVLVVEDEAALATMLRYNLEKQGFRVEEAADGQEALTRIAETQPDLVLLDWMLPVMSGIEVCRQLRRRSETRDLPVIMVTARTEDQDTVRGLNTGADDYITKPFNMEALLARMRALLRRRQRRPGERPAQFPRRDDGSGRPPGAAQRPAGASRPDRIPPAGVLHAASRPRFLARGAAGCGLGPGHPRRAAHRRRAYPPAAQVRSMAMASWTWSAPSGRRATRWTPSKSDKQQLIYPTRPAQRSAKACRPLVGRNDRTERSASFFCVQLIDCGGVVLDFEACVLVVGGRRHFLEPRQFAAATVLLMAEGDPVSVTTACVDL